MTWGTFPLKDLISASAYAHELTAEVNGLGTGAWGWTNRPQAKEEMGALGVGMEEKKFACIRSFENKF